MTTAVMVAPAKGVGGGGRGMTTAVMVAPARGGGWLQM